MEETSETKSSSTENSSNKSEESVMDGVRRLMMKEVLGVDCVICFEKCIVHAPTGSGYEEDINYYVTPCNHVFHPKCLARWMKNKMECPTCRAQL